MFESGYSYAKDLQEDNSFFLMSGCFDKGNKFQSISTVKEFYLKND